jgi:hypothetical protein
VRAVTSQSSKREIVTETAYAAFRIQN